MKTILSVDGRGALDDLAARRALLAFDFDGTLAPIVGDRDAAQMRPETRRLLRALALLYPCAVISGRERGIVPGLDVEDKWFSVAVHYRHVRSRATARGLVLRVATALERARVFGGRAVMNIVPAEAPDKGSALQELLRRAGPRPVLYVGDDRTDEDVFRSTRVDVGVHVGRTARSAAAWYVPRQAAVDDLLRALIAACTRRDGLGDRSEGLLRAVAG